MTSLHYLTGHETCALCDVCGDHLKDADQWPCLTCHADLCATCDCPNPHLIEVPGE